MPLYSWLLSSLLVGQIGGDPSAAVMVAPPTAIQHGPAIPAVTFPGTPANGGASIREPALPVVVGRNAIPSTNAPATPTRVTTPQLVADALALPPGNTISGRPVSLVSVVATVPERPRQIEAVHAYWRLAEAMGEYHFAHERQQRLAPLRAGNGEAADLRTARAIAEARLREAEVQLTTAQHDLAEILSLVPGTPLPLPADQPLVGPYRTLFAELFAGKTAPLRARMLDQTLPLRTRAVESHAAALLAAEDALDAAIELQTSGQDHLAGVLVALDAMDRQQRAFLAAVCRYNHEIADYALVVVSPQTTPELLVGTLIKLKPDAQARNAVTPLPTTATLPATYQQPVVPPGSNWPTRAVRPGASSAPVGNGLRTVPDDSPGSVGVLPASPAFAPSNPSPNDDPQEPRLAPPQESAIPLVPEKPAGPTTHSSQKPIGENGPPQASAQGAGSGERGAGSRPNTSGPPQASALETYPGLTSLTPAERTAKLTTSLYGTPRSPLPAPRSPLSAPTLRLIDCLRTTPANNRAKATDAYWNTRQIAAQYQSFVEQAHWLDALGPTLSAENPPSPTAMLKLRRARLAVEAERADTEADSTAAQFELAGLVGFGAEKGLPQPSSIPFVGRLPLPASRSDRSWSLRRLEATIPQREQAIINQAAAVVEADSSRTAATTDFLASRSSVDRVLAGIEVQARETSAFLRGVTEYNQAIAEYAIATLPMNTEAEKLVAVLGVESGERGAGSEQQSPKNWRFAPAGKNPNR